MGGGGQTARLVCRARPGSPDPLAAHGHARQIRTLRSALRRLRRCSSNFEAGGPLWLSCRQVRRASVQRAQGVAGRPNLPYIGGSEIWRRPQQREQKGCLEEPRFDFPSASKQQARHASPAGGTPTQAKAPPFSAWRPNAPAPPPRHRSRYGGRLPSSCGSMSAFRRVWGGFGQIWSGVHRTWPTSAEFSPISMAVGVLACAPSSWPHGAWSQSGASGVLAPALASPRATTAAASPRPSDCIRAANCSADSAPKSV